jgi:uncharacterized protein
VSKLLPNREQAIKLLQENRCSPIVIEHCLAVTELALEIACELKAKGFAIDLQLVESGALLHDLGRSKTHAVDHSVVGAQMAKSIGLPGSVVNIIKRHVGAGITDEEAQLLGWPKDNYVPQTLEEKIVCYADKRIDHGKVVPIDIEIQRLKSEGMAGAAERVRRLHDELTSLQGDKL